MKIKFHMPDFTINGVLNLMFIDFLKKKPEYFYDNVEIASVYGCFPPAIWNGGRCVSGDPTEDVIVRYINEFNSRNVPLRYTFTNPNIEKQHLSDKFCNRITELAHNGFNEIIVNSPVLEEYIRRQYPMYPIISSTIKQIEDLDDLKAELGKAYKLVVLDYNWNNDFERLEKIPNKDRCEILINPYCTPHCKRRGEHYRYVGRVQLLGCQTGNNEAIMSEAAKFNCPFLKYNFYQAQTFSTHIRVEDLYSKYVNMGFTNFKIEGRGFNLFNVLESYVYYLVKPEYREVTRLEMTLTLTGQPSLNVPTSADKAAAARKAQMTGARA